MWHDVRMMNATTNALLGLLALCLLASGAWWLAQRPMFTLRAIQIDAVEVEGLRHVSASTVRNTALPRIRGNFFTANLDQVRQAFESVPWVRKAAVRREWPNKLIVTLEEHQALGTWGEDGKLLSVKGDVFTANLAEAEDDGDLPEFAGPDGSEKDVVARYRDFANWFGGIKLAPEAVRLSGRYAWSVRLDNGMTVELGREQSKSTLKDRVDRLVAIYPQLAARLADSIENVDMRYPNGLALKARGLKLGAEGKKK
ncbi:cell division protein FtsQ [Noviherbaspirillum humi]|uniref:Cell division protein FtsQ n=1 Tax=Noviherbaspirillum humi TaxID=1688639 RepID=A0A239CNV9_9BURK|nr:cell division protein FtsQ/DivIB [Noviherbaspirillum humi]SNS21827.1 cell division protein FtsQ [Noviherbaspirillum humi]